MAPRRRRIRAFLDSNVLASGFYNPDGVPGLILRLAVQQRFRAILSQLVADEIARTLSSKLPRGLPAFRRFMLAARFELVGDPSDAEVAPWLDLIQGADAYVFAAVVKAKAEYFVTGNTRDFDDPAVLALAAPKLVTPRQFLELLETQPA